MDDNLDICWLVAVTSNSRIDIANTLGFTNENNDINGQEFVEFISHGRGLVFASIASVVSWG